MLVCLFPEHEGCVQCRTCTLQVDFGQCCIALANCVPLTVMGAATRQPLQSTTVQQNSFSRK